MWKSALAVLAAAGVLVLPAATSHAAREAEAKSPWQLFGQTRVPAGEVVVVPTWAANRVWVLAAPAADGTLASARVSGRRMTSFAAQRLSAGDVRGISGLSRDWFVDGQLIVRTGDGTLDDPVATARLLPDGRLGAPKIVPDDLVARAKEAVPQVEEVAIHNGVRVGDRIVWALAGFPEARGPSDSRNFLLACCGESGAAVDLTRFKGGLRTGLLFPTGGWDTRGRLWLAWLDTRDSGGAVLGVPRILQLAGATLAPRSEAVAPPGVVASKFELVCASTCRIVAQTAGGDIVSWAPGERSPTRVVTHAKHPYVKLATYPAQLIAASYRSGDLVVGYHIGRFSPKGTLDEIRVARGNARGDRARVVGAIAVLDRWPPGDPRQRFSSPFPINGTFAPSGLVVAAAFQYTPPGAPSPLVAAFIPLGR